MWQRPQPSRRSRARMERARHSATRARPRPLSIPLTLNLSDRGLCRTKSVAPTRACSAGDAPISQRHRHGSDRARTPRAECGRRRVPRWRPRRRPRPRIGRARRRPRARRGRRPSRGSTCRWSRTRSEEGWGRVESTVGRWRVAAGGAAWNPTPDDADPSSLHHPRPGPVVLAQGPVRGVHRAHRRAQAGARDPPLRARLGRAGSGVPRAAGGDRRRVVGRGGGGG
jgi:hypothetical protein